MIFGLMLTPYVLVLLIVRPYLEDSLRKKHSKTFIRKNNKGNWLQRLLFWCFRNELNPYLYGLLFASFILPLTVPPIYFLAGKDGLVFYYFFCTVLSIVCLVIAWLGCRETSPLFLSKKKGIWFATLVDDVYTMLCVLLLAGICLAGIVTLALRLLGVIE